MHAVLASVYMPFSMHGILTSTVVFGGPNAMAEN